MNWISNYNVLFDRKLYENCMECRVHTNLSYGLRSNKSTRDIRTAEVIYINDEGKLDVLAGAPERFKFIKKPVEIKCDD
ncbi:hypothetical protein Aargi30884_27730 [Amedibacterium intestinale]|jgi:hypothetical protein|uniref:Uncharacterized protein n=1 Tax=Amedibacterium intestinale TaxID=2583452 RepID=A0A6N4TLD7_9FIRM|nr:hypothetical protein [Amedibacterium intestinale]BBK23870.1 hypothetical protein Aargi30884_27730 [Amedibacterium intestinale]DAQ11595.1 MAG TPA: hypothetical protein [Caudoviricetes sp.]